MFDFKELFFSFLPLHFDSITYDGDSLLILGEAWKFSCSSAWRVSKDEKLLFTFLDNGAVDLLRDFHGLSIVGMEWLIEKQQIDPSLLFSDGRRIDVFCSYSCDPWVIELPDGSIYVGDYS